MGSGLVWSGLHPPGIKLLCTIVKESCNVSGVLSVSPCVIA